jgi:hypothetical protein
LSYRTAVGSGPKKMLDAVSANLTGPNHDFGVMHTSIALQVELTGAPTGGTISVYGSLDGVNFDPTALVVWTIGTQSSGNIQVATGKGFIWVQAILAGLTGGTTPTVTAIAAAY